MPQPSAKKWIWAAWLAFVLGFVLYLFRADRAYHALSGRSHLVRMTAEVPPPARGDLKLSSVFDYAPVNNKFEEGKEFRAKFYTIADAKTVAKTRVFFRSPGAVYELAANRRPLWAHARKAAVNFFASTAGLETGVYTLGLAVEDDDGPRMAWLDSFFEKTPGGPVKYVARPVALALGRTCPDVAFAFECIGTDGIQGWVVRAGADMDDYHAYVVVAGPGGFRRAYYAPLYTRMDVAAQRGDPRAANSGFKIAFPKNEFPPGTYAVRMALQSRETGEVLESAQKWTTGR